MANILIVDDEKSIRISLREFLLDEGYEACMAEDANKAMEMLAKENFDVVLADVILPKITGMSLLKSIKETSPHIQVVLMTGGPSVETASEAVRRGAFDYMAKPIGKDQLLTTVANAVRVKTLDDERRRLAKENQKHQENLERLVEERTTALRESEERYRAIVEDAPLLICRFLPNGEITYINETYCRCFEKTSEELVGQTFLSLIHEADREAVMAGIFALTSKSPTQSHEHRVIAPGGEIRWQRWTNRALFDAKGQAVAYQSIGEDITERKQAEKKLRESEKRLHYLADAAIEAIFINKKGICFEANQTAADMFGYNDSSELIGIFGTDIIAPECHQIVEDHMLTNSAEPYEAVGLRKDGSKFPISIHAKSMPYKNKGEVRVTSVRDISDLKEQERRFQIVAEASADIIYEWDLNTDKLVWMGDIDSELGYNQGEIAGTIKGWAKMIHPEDMEMLKNAVEHHRRSTEPFEYTYRVKQKDGTWRYWHDRGYPILNFDNLPIKWIGACSDITERKQLEEQLVQAQKMEAIGTLAGGIAHDFNNILSPIIGYTEMVHMDLPDGGRAKANLEEVLAASERAKDLVTQILTFSRKTQEEKKPLNIAYIVNEVLKFMRSSLPSTIEIKPHVKKDCGTVMADYTQIHQVVMNLCTNAFHAMREDGGILKVTLVPTELGFEDMTPGFDLSSGPHIKLTISDTGCGIASEVKDRIFEPYFTTREVGEGTGMGLAVSHAIVIKHHGAISVQSEPGKGTVFDVYLPVVEKISVRQKDPAKMPVLTGDERILLVDDEAPILEMIAQMLENLGYSVWPMASSEKALEAFMVSPDEFDLVFTDMTMPHITGDMLARKILEIRPEIPVILCTGFSEKITPKKAKEIGIAAFVKKPVVMNEIATAIRKILDKE